MKTVADDPGLQDEARGAEVPVKEFVDQGGLHAVNEEVFWPLGLFLVATRVGATETLPKLATTVLKAALKRAPSDVEMGRAVDALRREDWYLEGLALRAAEPPEVVHTSLPKREHQARHEAWTRWTDARRAALRP